MAVLRRAGWWARDYLAAGLWQVRARLTRQRPQDFRVGTRRPVVVLPGVYEGWGFMLPIIRDRPRRGHPVHVVTALRDNRIPVPEGARRVRHYLARMGLSDVVIIAHSKGGLVGKYVMGEETAAAEGDAGATCRVRTMVAIATPFAGSRYARLMWNRTLRSFAPHDPVLAQLAKLRAPNARIVSVFPSFDPHIPEGSVLGGAQNVRVPTAGHFRVLTDPEVSRVIRAAAAGELPDPGENEGCVPVSDIGPLHHPKRGEQPGN